MGHIISEAWNNSRVPVHFLLSPLLNKVQVSPVKSLSFLIYNKLLSIPTAFLFHPQRVKRRLYFCKASSFPYDKKSPQMIYNTQSLHLRRLLRNASNPNWNLKAITAGPPNRGSVIRVIISGNKVQIVTKSWNHGLKQVTRSAWPIHSESNSILLFGSFFLSLITVSLANIREHTVDTQTSCWVPVPIFTSWLLCARQGLKLRDEFN